LGAGGGSISAPKSLGREIEEDIDDQGNAFWWLMILTLLTRDDDADTHVHQTSISTPVTMAGFGGNESPMLKW
jgi:hypothetical protein